MQALKCWPETIEKEDHVEKEVLHKLIDPSKVQFDTWSVTRCYRAKGHVNLVQCRKTCQKKNSTNIPPINTKKCASLIMLLLQ